MNFESLNELIRSRRSIYPAQYSGDRVEKTIIQQLLENANWAPNHKLTEPWRFVVYSGEGLKKLGNLQAEFYKEYTTTDGSYSEERFQNLIKKPTEASHVIAIGLHRDPKKSVPEIEETGAVFCAIQNMYLTATAYGIGCYLGTGGITHFENAGTLFGFDKLLGYFYLGIPREGFRAVGHRKPISEKVRWVME